MPHARIVIGAGYGDEGKGHTVDWLAAQSATHHSCVVRFNGGAQAGHTVAWGPGQRHVFSHFGCGTVVGLPTFLSRFFVSNPILFAREYQKLQQLNLSPLVWADPAGQLTTPYDMMINQMLEQSRGQARHGSCGVGFGETLARAAYPEFSLQLADLTRPDWIMKLYAIQQHWVPQRLQQLGYTPTPTWQARLTNGDIMENFIHESAQMLAHIELRAWQDLSLSHYIFEGAQGLQLDQDYGQFPHVTRSHTGLKNVVALAAEQNIDTLETYYTTRTYTTRHGAGPLAHELAAAPSPLISDPTNQPNDFQGHLRFAWLDLDQLTRAIQHDWQHAKQAGLRLHNTLMVNGLDQFAGALSYYDQGQLHTAPDTMALAVHAAGRLAHSQLAVGAGTQRSDRWHCPQLSRQHRHRVLAS